MFPLLMPGERETSISTSSLRVSPRRSSRFNNGSGYLTSAGGLSLTKEVTLGIIELYRERKKWFLNCQNLLILGPGNS